MWTILVERGNRLLLNYVTSNKNDVENKADVLGLPQNCRGYHSRVVLSQNCRGYYIFSRGYDSSIFLFFRIRERFAYHFHSCTFTKLSFPKRWHGRILGADILRGKEEKRRQCSADADLFLSLFLRLMLMMLIWDWVSESESARWSRWVEREPSRILVSWSVCGLFAHAWCSDDWTWGAVGDLVWLIITY